MTIRIINGKFFAQFLCFFCLFLGLFRRFLTFKTRNAHFLQLSTNSHLGNTKLTTKSSLTDSFAIIGQSFQLILYGRKLGGQFLFCLRLNLHFGNDLWYYKQFFGGNLLFQSDLQFLIFPFVESKIKKGWGGIFKICPLFTKNVGVIVIFKMLIVDIQLNETVVCP